MVSYARQFAAAATACAALCAAQSAFAAVHIETSGLILDSFYSPRAEYLVSDVGGAATFSLVNAVDRMRYPYMTTYHNDFGSIFQLTAREGYKVTGFSVSGGFYGDYYIGHSPDGSGQAGSAYSEAAAWAYASDSYGGASFAYGSHSVANLNGHSDFRIDSGVLDKTGSFYFSFDGYVAGSQSPALWYSNEPGETWPYVDYSLGQVGLKDPAAADGLHPGGAGTAHVCDDPGGTGAAGRDGASAQTRRAGSLTREMPMRRLFALFSTFLLLCLAPRLHAAEEARLALTVDVTHIAKDRWRVDYRLSYPVTALQFDAVGDYRRQAWRVSTPGMRLMPGPQTDVIAAGGRRFDSVSVDITTFDGLAPKSYAPFNRFSDGGTAVFLGHLQGKAYRGKHAFAMAAEIGLHGLPGDTVIAPPLNPQAQGAERGYAYFGPAQPVHAGASRFLVDPATPAWMRELMQDVGARVSAYYEKAYRRALSDGVLVMVSVSGFEEKGLAMKGGAVLGQLSYRFDGQKLLADHPKYREVLARLVAHEIAHLWQMNVARGGIGEKDPWIYEGGADAMAIDALLQTDIWSGETATAYRAAQSASCDRLGNATDSFDGMYACGLVRFDRLGIDIVPLWRSMMQASEASGEVYSQAMIDALAGAKEG